MNSADAIPIGISGRTISLFALFGGGLSSSSSTPLNPPKRCPRLPPFFIRLPPNVLRPPDGI